MAEQRPSRQEMIRRRRRGGFVGRRGELAVFRDNLAREPGSEGYDFLFHVHGIAGVGKTSLVRQWETVAREHAVVTAYLGDDVHSAIEAMETISTQLARRGCPLKGFDKLAATYRQRRHEAETATAAPAAAEPADPGQAPVASPSSTLAAQLGLAAVGLVPVVGAFTSSTVDPQQVALGADRLRALLGAKFRNHDDVQLVLSPLQMLTPTFMEDLAEAARRQPWVVLFFDVFEQTGPMLGEWLRDVLLTERYGELPVNVQVVLSGQGRLDGRCWGDWLDLVTEVPLEVFTEDEARALLAAKGVTDERVVELVLRLTGGLPVLVDMLAQARPAAPDAVEDPSDTAVERFLKWETDPDRRTAALVCALPLRLDEDIYRAIVPETVADQYAWLRGLAFVTDQAGSCRYHDVVREPMLRRQRTQSPTRWREQHTRLAEAFRHWREALEGTLPEDDRWDDGVWREHRLNETYHRLCANPHQALREALHDAVHACDHSTATLRRWAQIFTQAGQDTDAEALTSWGQRLLPVTDEENAGVISALSALLGSTELGTAGKALAYAVRGREHRLADSYDKALADYTQALALDPNLARAYSGRAHTYSRLGRYDDALADYNRAIEINPNDAWYLSSRGETHHNMSHHDDALTDHNRAIESEPGNELFLARRGETYRVMKRYNDALTDYSRAIENDPKYAWALTRRAQTYRDLERYDNALADYNRAIEINPKYTWALARRAQTYRVMKRYNDALTDHNRIIEIEPDDSWVIAERGETYRVMKRYDDALTDYSRAIEIDPKYVWALTCRAQTYRAMERYEDAFADHNRAVEIEPNDAWVVCNRGESHRFMSHNLDALVDLNRAIEIEPDYAWALTCRAQTYRDMGHYDDALTDHMNAIENEPRDAWIIAQRGETYRLMKRHEDALADFNHVIEIESENMWALMGRGQVHRAMGRYDNALADFSHATEIKTDSGWGHYELAITCRLMGRAEHEHWQCAVEMIAAEATRQDSDAVHALGNLLIVYCALPEWDKATEYLDSFLNGRPSPGRIRDALDDLKDLCQTLDVDETRLEPLRQRLEAMLTDTNR